LGEGGHWVSSTSARLDENSVLLYADILAGKRKCQSECAYFGVCGGGAPSNNSTDSTETAYCRSHKRAIDVSFVFIERLPAVATEPASL